MGLKLESRSAETDGRLEGLAGSEVLWSLMAAVAGCGWHWELGAGRVPVKAHLWTVSAQGHMGRLPSVSAPPGPAGDHACVSSPSHWVNYKYIKFPALQRTEGGVPAGTRDLPSGTPSVGRSEPQKDLF